MTPSRMLNPFVCAGLLLIASACGVPPEPELAPPAPPAEQARGWDALPASPLSPRTEAHAFWTGDRVLVVGGSDTGVCPPGADCALPAESPLRDGASFDPSSGQWQELARAPVPLGQLTGASVPDALYVLVHGFEPARGVRPAFLVYQIFEDVWEELAAPPIPPGSAPVLVAAGDRIVAYHPTQEQGHLGDLLYDPATGEWTDVPADPLLPSFDRTMAWTGEEVLLTGPANVRDPNADLPSLYRAAGLDVGTGLWRRLPDSEVVAWNPTWFWAGGRLVNPSVGSADGGEVNNWGRDYPFGGILDPGTGVWSPLPQPPKAMDPYRGLSAGGPEYLVASEGFVLHVPTLTWAALTKPRAGEEAGAASVWAGDRLFVWGGVRLNGAETTLLGGGWTWQP